MDTFGQQLKSMREEKGLTLQEVGDITKIAISNLDLLERDRYELLPPKVFLRGFVRSYAQCVGANPEELLKRFEQYAKEGEIDYDENDDRPLFMQSEKQGQGLWGVGIPTIIFTAVGAISFIILLLTAVVRLASVDAVDNGAPIVTAVGPRERADGSMVDNDQQVFRAENGFDASQPAEDGKRVLEIRSQSQAWLRVTPDSGPAVDIVMEPDEVKVFTAKERFHIMTGNAGGIRLTFDGQLLPVLGKEHETVARTLP